MRRKKQLDRLKMIRALICEQVKDEVSQEQFKLASEENTLERLEDYQKNYIWDKDRQASGLVLNSAQMMAENVEKAVKHQQQQVAVQLAKCRTIRQKLMLEKRKLKTAESLLDRHQKKLDKKSEKQEQALQDEFAIRAFSYGSSF